MKQVNFTEILKRLPASLIFILIVDWSILKSLVNLYKFQIEKSDPNNIYVLISIFVVVLFNLFIISAFARVRVLQEKQRKLEVS